MRVGFALLLALAFISRPVHAQPKRQLIDGIVAVVGDEIILQSDIEAQKDQMSQQGMPDDQITDCGVLENLLYQKLLLNQSKVDSLEVTDEQVQNELNKRLAMFIQQIGSEEALEKYYHKSMAEIREEFTGILKDQLLVQKMQSEITKNLDVTPADVEDYYNSLPKDSLPYVNAAVQLQQIVKDPKISPDEVKRIKDKLNEYRKEVVDGKKDFSTLAVLYSDDEASAVKGGELGMHPRGTFVPEFDAVAFTLKDGEVSKVFKTKYGYHIMQMIERRGDVYNARHILLKPKVTPAELQATKDYLDSLATQIRLDSISFKEAARKYSDDDNSKNQNGNIVNDKTGSTTFKMNELDPQLFTTIDTLEPGQISNAAYMTTEAGEKAYRLVKLISRTKPHKANLKDDYEMIMNKATEVKRQKMIDDWMKKHVSTTYVYLDPAYRNCKFQYDWLNGGDANEKP